MCPAAYSSALRTSTSTAPFWTRSWASSGAMTPASASADRSEDVDSEAEPAGVPESESDPQPTSAASRASMARSDRNIAPI